MPTRDQLLFAPKVLLHDHLDGGLRPQTVIDLAEESGYKGLPSTEPVALAQWFASDVPRRDLVRYLEGFTHTVGVMQTKDALERVARECVEDLAADGVVYAEVRFAPELHTDGGLELETVVTSVLSGFESGMAAAAANRTPIVIRALLTAMRTAARSLEIAELAVAFRDAGVCGFDVAGAEAGYPPTRHLDAFQLVQRENFHATLHAGEAFGLPSIWEALQWCNAERLGHGVRIVDDIAVAPSGEIALGRLASYVRDRRVPLEMCPTRGEVAGRAPDRAAPPAAVPRHSEHRQPAHERRDDVLGDGVALRGVRLGLRRPRVADAQRDEVRILPVRQAPRAHRHGHQAALRPAHRRVAPHLADALTASPGTLSERGRSAR